MKTKVLSLIAVAAIALGIGNQALAAGKNDSAARTEVSTVLTDVTRISKIEVRGNVELYVSNAASDEVKVYNRYYGESALVQNHNGVLRISSYSDQKLVVWVKASDLHTVAAYDNAEVRSFGKIAYINLDVTLSNNAYAKLDVNSFGMNINIKDRAKADLSGNVTECSLKYDHSATVNSTEFVADHISRTVEGIAADNKQNDWFAGL
jgi:hypothetical protein